MPVPVASEAKYRGSVGAIGGGCDQRNGGGMLLARCHMDRAQNDRRAAGVRPLPEITPQMRAAAVERKQDRHPRRRVKPFRYLGAEPVDGVD